MARERLAKLGSHSNRSSDATRGGNTKHCFKPGAWRCLALIGTARDCVFLNIVRCWVDVELVLGEAWQGKGSPQQNSCPSPPVEEEDIP